MFLENYQFFRKSENNTNSRGSCSLRHYDAMRTKIDMWFTLTLKQNLYYRIICSWNYLSFAEIDSFIINTIGEFIMAIVNVFWPLNIVTKSPILDVVLDTDSPLETLCEIMYGSWITTKTWPIENNWFDLVSDLRSETKGSRFEFGC